MSSHTEKVALEAFGERLNVESERELDLRFWFGKLDLV